MTEDMRQPDTPTLCRGSRCGLCYWALYDGDWCQNKDCKNYPNSVGGNRIRLTNEEARVLILASPKEPRPPALERTERIPAVVKANSP